LSDVFIELLPLVISALLVPIYPIVVLLLLESERGLAKATAAFAGNTIVRVLQGIIFGLVFRQSMEEHPEDGGELIVAILLLLVGILLLIAGYKKWQKEEDPDGPPPQWMTAVSGLSTFKAFGAGAIYVLVSVKQWVFTLSAISIIDEAMLSDGASIGLYTFFTLATQIFALVPIVMYAVAPQTAAKPVKATQAWLERHNRTIAIAVSLIFGVWFTFKGINGLIN
jgi:hypothetical protein